MSTKQAEEVLAHLEFISSKQSVMEQRQCDSLGQGTDASRMLESWTRGHHANPSENARAFLRKRVLLCKSWRATSYTSIFSEKDFVRGEKQLFKFYEQYVRGFLTGTYDSEEYDEIGASLAWLPIWRGVECMCNEIYLETTPISPQYKDSLELLPLLPAEDEGYTESYKVMQELMLPLDTKFSGESFLVESTSTSWQPIRHALRRVSLLETYEHPFENVHAKEPAELYRELPEDVKEYIEACPACVGIDDPRDKFTRGVVFWNEYYKDLEHRSNEDPLREIEWDNQARTMDEFIKRQKPRIWAKINDDESASTASYDGFPAIAERGEGS